MDDKVETALIDVVDALEMITVLLKEKLHLTRDIPEYDQLIASVEGLASTLKMDNGQEFQNAV